MEFVMSLTHKNYLSVYVLFIFRLCIPKSFVLTMEGFNKIEKTFLESIFTFQGELQYIFVGKCFYPI